LKNPSLFIAIAKESHLLGNDFTQVNQVLKSKNIMTDSKATLHCDLLHCIQRAEALIQVLGEAVHQSGNTHHAIMVEVIEEYLLRARKSLGDR
jgi:hypothetical protein